MQYIVESRLRHDGKIYTVGSVVEMSKVQAKPFLDSGLLTEQQTPSKETSRSKKTTEVENSKSE